MTQNKIILGCMNLVAEPNVGSVTQADLKLAQEAVETALECGINTFDHADIYAGGKAEKVFGEMLKQIRNLRFKVKVQTKAGIILHAGVHQSNYYDNTKDYLLNSVQESLKRLNLPGLSMFLIHRPDILASFKETAEALSELKKKGIVEKIGVSNFSLAQLNALQNFCDFRIEANQIRLNLQHSLPIDDYFFAGAESKSNSSGLSGFFEHAQLNAVEIQAYSPLARGVFDPKNSTGEEHLSEAKKYLNILAEKYRTNTSAVLLAWIFGLPARTTAIIGTSKPDRIRLCAEALTIMLSREDWYNLYISAKGWKLP